MDSTTLTPSRYDFSHDSKAYYLLEPSAGAIRRYRNAASEGMTLKDGKVQGSVKDPGRLEILLLTLTVRDENGKPVTDKLIEEWPARFVKDLHKRAFGLSGLKERTLDEQLKEALTLSESPISYDSLREYVIGLDSAKFGAVKEVFEDLEESSKN